MFDNTKLDKPLKFHLTCPTRQWCLREALNNFVSDDTGSLSKTMFLDAYSYEYRTILNAVLFFLPIDSLSAMLGATRISILDNYVTIDRFITAFDKDCYLNYIVGFLSLEPVGTIWKFNISGHKEISIKSKPELQFNERRI